jgi:hypothetical protein
MGADFKFNPNLESPEGLSLIQVNYKPHLSVDSTNPTKVVAQLALPDANEVFYPQFISVPAVQVLIEERQELQKRLLSYERKSFPTEIKTFIDTYLLSGAPAWETSTL